MSNPDMDHVHERVRWVIEQRGEMQFCVDFHHRLDVLAREGTPMNLTEVLYWMGCLRRHWMPGKRLRQVA